MRQTTPKHVRCSRLACQRSHSRDAHVRSGCMGAQVYHETKLDKRGDTPHVTQAQAPPVAVAQPVGQPVAFAQPVGAPMANEESESSAPH